MAEKNTLEIFFENLANTIRKKRCNKKAAAAQRWLPLSCAKRRSVVKS